MFKNKKLSAFLASALLLGSIPLFSQASQAKMTSLQPLSQGLSNAFLKQATYLSNLTPNTVVTADIVLHVHNQNKLAQYIQQTTTPNSPNYQHYLTPAQYKEQFAPTHAEVQAVKDYFAKYGITSKVSDNNVIVSLTGTAKSMGQAFHTQLHQATYLGKTFHATKTPPQIPAYLANTVLCVVGLSDYSFLSPQHIKHPSTITTDAKENSLSATPSGKMPNDLIKQYNVQPLITGGATGKGQTIGIVTLADFNVADAYKYWDYLKLSYDKNRITKINVDGGSTLSENTGSGETTLDVQQSGALAPQANVNVYIAPNNGTGFLDAFAKAINDNVTQQVSASWGESETLIKLQSNQKVVTPQYAAAFDTLFQQAAAQGISMFAAAGDSGAYSASADVGSYNLSVISPADSPYITAAGGTTLPFSAKSNGISIQVPTERAWGWDYLYPFFDSLGYNNPNGWASTYFVGGGGGFSQFFATPSYQVGVKGINAYTAIQRWTSTGTATTVSRLKTPLTVKGTGTGRNIPDISMNADPYTGYSVYASLPTTTTPNAPVNTGWSTAGGTSFVAPQLCGLSALINSTLPKRIGFWNPQLYTFAKRTTSPLHPLNSSTNNNNLFYTGTTGTIYNQATGLGTPDVTALAKAFSGK